jgi:hypothetical protein
MVSAFQHGGHEKKDALFRAVMNEDVLRASEGIQTTHLITECGASLGLRVSQAQTQEFLLRPGLQRKELLDAHGLAIGGAEVQLNAELVFGKVALKGKGRQLHGPTVRIFAYRGKSSTGRSMALV